MSHVRIACSMTEKLWFIFVRFWVAATNLTGKLTYVIIVCLLKKEGFEGVDSQNKKNELIIKRANVSMLQALCEVNR